MKDHVLTLQMENLKTVIQIEKDKFSMAILQQTELPVLIKMREEINRLRNELKILEDHVNDARNAAERDGSGQSM